MRHSWFGNSSLIILAFHSIILALDFANLFDYTRTLLFPLICLFALLISLIGLMEKDKVKKPSVFALILGILFLGYWILMLVLRLKGQV